MEPDRFSQNATHYWSNLIDPSVDPVPPADGPSEPLLAGQRQ
jgi:hypothetical protein